MSSGPARGGHGEPDSSFVPRSTKKHRGMCPLEGGPWASPSWGAGGGAASWLLSGPWASRSLDIQAQRTSVAHPIQKVPRGTIAPRAQLAPLSPWPEPPALPPSPQSRTRTRTASCPWMSKAAPTPPRTRQTARTMGWRPRASGTRLGAPSTAPLKVRPCWVACLRPASCDGEQQPGGGTAGGVDSRVEVLAGEGPVHSICRAEAGRSLRVSSGPPTSRTPLAGPECCWGAGVEPLGC